MMKSAWTLFKKNSWVPA